MNEHAPPHDWFSRGVGAFCDVLRFDGNRMTVATIRCEEMIARIPPQSLPGDDVIEVSNDEVRIVTVHPDRNAVVVHFRHGSDSESRIEFPARSSQEHDRLVAQFALWLGRGFSFTRRRTLEPILDDITERVTAFLCIGSLGLLWSSVADVSARGVGKIVHEFVGRTALKHAGIWLLIAGGLFLLGWNWYRWRSRVTILSFVRAENLDDER